MGTRKPLWWLWHRVWCIHVFVAVRVNKVSTRVREANVDSHAVMTSVGERENGSIHRGALDVAPT